ncbi:hypothetical protein, partial [Jeotgalibaca porci]|uniref:hypothetical protein n=1 Tax=Jeotgalibaca porci TaxID=1868793 RepID=UPI004039142F
MKHNNHENLGGNLRSEEVQAIVDRMPTHWTQWVALCVSTLMGLVILLGFVIQYPDTVDGNISVTANAAPIRLVSKDNGRLILLTSNRSMLHKGDVIAYIDNGANYQHLLQLEKLLQQMSLSSIHQQRMPDTLILGNISSVYNNFMFSYQQYQRLLSSDIYATMRQSIQQQIISDEAVIKNINQEIILKQQIIKESRNRLKKDSILLSVKGISDQEYQNQYTQHLNLQESHLSLNSSRQIKLSEINHNKMEMQRIFLEESEAKEKNYADLMTKKNELFNA